MDPAPNNLTAEHRWLRRFCYLVIVATFTLIAIGGKVTSFEYGMAIPEGFTTGGWLSFLAPLKYWFNDTDKFWEHTHRIKGTVVGFLTIAMTIWLWRSQKHRPWLKWSGLVMLLLVISQGIMGALRVSEISLTLAFVHGIVGQLILCSWVVVAAALSKPWLHRIRSIKQAKRDHATATLRWAVRVLLVLLIAQLTLGSAVRHFKADKAIPDFPLVYDGFLPPVSQASLDQAYVDYYASNLSSADAESAKANGLISNRSPQGEIVVTLSDVYLQYAHRLGAVVVCLLGFYIIASLLLRIEKRSIVLAPALIVLTLFIGQFALGVITVFTGTDPLMATLHQATGAVLIASATWLAVRIHLAEYPAQPVRSDEKQANPAPAAAPASVTPVTA